MRIGYTMELHSDNGKENRNYCLGFGVWEPDHFGDSLPGVACPLGGPVKQRAQTRNPKSSPGSTHVGNLTRSDSHNMIRPSLIANLWQPDEHANKPVKKLLVVRTVGNGETDKDQATSSCTSLGSHFCYEVNIQRKTCSKANQRVSILLWQNQRS